MRKNLPASEVIDLLIQGNARFINGLRSIDTFLTVMNKGVLASKGQFPFCTLLTCSDSRIPIELIYDRGLGDLFVMRSFGNIVDPLIIASIEYSILSFGIQAVVVMGHSRSGAIRLAMETDANPSSVKSPILRAAVEKVMPALNQARAKHGYFDKLQKKPGNEEIWEKIFQTTCQEHVRNSCQEIQKQSPIINEKVAKGELFLVPALYDIAEGRVTFDLPAKLAAQVDKNVVQLEAFKQAKTALDILETSLKTSGRQK